MLHLVSCLALSDLLLSANLHGGIMLSQVYTNQGTG